MRNWTQCWKNCLRVIDWLVLLIVCCTLKKLNQFVWTRSWHLRPDWSHRLALTIFYIKIHPVQMQRDPSQATVRWRPNVTWIPSARPQHHLTTVWNYPGRRCHCFQICSISIPSNIICRNSLCHTNGFHRTQHTWNSMRMHCKKVSLSSSGKIWGFIRSSSNRSICPCLIKVVRIDTPFCRLSISWHE